MPVNEKAEHFDHKRGALCLIFAGFFFAAMAVFVRLAGDAPTFEKAFFRNLIALFVSGAALRREHVPLKVDPAGRPFVLLRIVLGTGSILCNFYAIDHLNLADASILNKMSPFYLVLFSFLLLKERVTLRQVVIMALAFLGSLLVVKPSPSNLVLFPALISALSGILNGAALAGLRGATIRGVPKTLIIFLYSVFSTVVVFPLVLIDFQWPTGQQLLFMLLSGCCSAAGQFCITAGYSYAPARDISIYDFTQVLFAAVFGAVLFGQRPDALSLLGYVVIIGLSVFNFLWERKDHAEVSCNEEK